VLLRRVVNASFGKIGRLATKNVTLQLLQSKYIPVLLYGLEACPLSKAQLTSIDFVFNRFLMKLFQTNNVTIVNFCREMFDIDLPSVTLSHRKEKFIQRLNTVTILQ